MSKTESSMTESLAKPLFAMPKLERETLHERAYEELKKAVMSGAISPGTTITIRSMAAALGTSPMPVREALRRLVAEHILDMLPTRSVTLPLMSLARFDELCCIRLSLEGMVTETAARARSESEFAEIERAYVDLSRVKPRQTAQYLARNREFHFAIYRAARMPLALRIIEGLWLQAGPWLNIVLTEHGIGSGDDHHGAVMSGIRSKNTSAARKALEADIFYAAELIRAHLKSQAGAAA